MPWEGLRGQGMSCEAAGFVKHTTTSAWDTPPLPLLCATRDRCGIATERGGLLHVVDPVHAGRRLCGETVRKPDATRDGARGAPRAGPAARRKAWSCAATCGPAGPKTGGQTPACHVRRVRQRCVELWMPTLDAPCAACPRPPASDGWHLGATSPPACLQCVGCQRIGAKWARAHPERTSWCGGEPAARSGAGPDRA